jgi:hypothetical protein
MTTYARKTGFPWGNIVDVGRDSLLQIIDLYLNRFFWRGIENE